MDALLAKQNVIFDDIVPENFDTGMNNVTTNNYELFTNNGSGSGGFAHHIFCHAAQELYNIDIDKVEFKPLRFVSLFTKLILLKNTIFFYIQLQMCYNYYTKQFNCNYLSQKY